MNHHAGIVRIGSAAIVLAIVTSAFGYVVPALAGSAVQPAATTSRGTAPIATTGTVVGAAWKGDTTPFPKARIRLRDVETGRGIARTVSDGDGRFRFEAVKPGAFVVELLSNDDRVLATGDLFAVIAGGEAVTSVRLTARAPWFGGFFGNAAGGVIAAASTLGVTATGSDGRPVSPQ
jgi:hypothetical protein